MLTHDVYVFNRTRLAGSGFIVLLPDKSLECQLDCNYYAILIISTSIILSCSIVTFDKYEQYKNSDKCKNNKNIQTMFRIVDD